MKPGELKEWATAMRESGVAELRLDDGATIILGPDPTVTTAPSVELEDIVGKKEDYEDPYEQADLYPDREVPKIERQTAKDGV